MEFTDLLTERGKTAPIRWPMKPATTSKFNCRLDDFVEATHELVSRSCAEPLNVL